MSMNMNYAHACITGMSTRNLLLERKCEHEIVINNYFAWEMWKVSLNFTRNSSLCCKYIYFFLFAILIVSVRCNMANTIFNSLLTNNREEKLKFNVRWDLNVFEYILWELGIMNNLFKKLFLNLNSLKKFHFLSSNP